MSRRLRDESGMTLIAAVLIVFGMLSFGLAMLAAADTQSKTSARERTREASFNLAEAALNAQALQLTRNWPAANAPVCTPTVANSNCPDIASLQGGYATGDYAATPCATSPTTPAYQTSIYDNATGEQYWRQTIMTSSPARANWDANGDGVVWIRSVATARCHSVAIVSQASQSQIPIAFPSNVVTANWIETSNQGKKVIVDTLGSGGQPAPVVTRCAGLSTAQCQNYQAAKGQVSPPAIRSDSTGSTSTLTATQLAALESQAKAAGSYFAGCPTAAQLTSPANGAPVYIKSCNVNVTGTLQINSLAKPGALIIETGTLTLGGTVNFYGLIYMVNKGNVGHPNPVVTIGGNAQIYGVVSVDGNGGIRAGSSKTNLVNDPRAVGLLRGSSAARINKNTFRIVPVD
jgi:Tfp pilus assembly protein PilX